MAPNLEALLCMGLPFLRCRGCLVKPKITFRHRQHQDAEEVAAFFPVTICPHCFSTSEERVRRWSEQWLRPLAQVDVMCSFCRLCDKCKWFDDLTHDPSYHWHSSFYCDLIENAWLDLRAMCVTRRYIEDCTYDSQYY